MQLHDVIAQLRGVRLIGLRVRRVHRVLLDGHDVPAGVAQHVLQRLAAVDLPLLGVRVGQVGRDPVPVLLQGRAADRGALDDELIARRLDDLRQVEQGVVREAVANDEDAERLGVRGGRGALAGSRGRHQQERSASRVSLLTRFSGSGMMTPCGGRDLQTGMPRARRLGTESARCRHGPSIVPGMQSVPTGHDISSGHNFQCARRLSCARMPMTARSAVATDRAWSIESSRLLMKPSIPARPPVERHCLRFGLPIPGTYAC